MENTVIDEILFNSESFVDMDVINKIVISPKKNIDEIIKALINEDEEKITLNINNVSMNSN